MSQTQDRMQTDYLWLRDHSSADDWAKGRYFSRPSNSAKTFCLEPTVIIICTITSPTREKDSK